MHGGPTAPTDTAICPRPALPIWVVLVNFQSHDDYDLGVNAISPGYAGALRDQLESLSGCHVAYFNGASGNLSSTSKLESRNHGLEDSRSYGQKLGSLAWEAMQSMEPVGGSGIASTAAMTIVEVDHDWDELLPEAEQAVHMGTTLGGQAGDAFAMSYGFHSTHHAGTVVTRAGMDDIALLYQGAFRIHDLGFLAASYEMFSENGQSVKDRSPYKHTFIFSGNHEHVPSINAFGYASYEGDSTYYVTDTAEQLQEEFLVLLKKIQ